MSLVYLGAEPQPSLAWTFESSNVDYVTNRSPVYSTINTATTYAPTYSSGKYNLGMQLQNNSGTQSNTWVRYTFSTPIAADSGVTLSCWVKYTTLTIASSAIATLYDNITSGFANTMSIGMTTTGTVGYSSGASFYSSNLVPNSVSGTYSGGTWYHLAVTFNSSSIIGYLNGVAATSKSTLTTGLSFAGLRLGTYVNNFNDNSGFAQADCTIDDLRIYNRALTAAQVQSIYSQNGVPASNFRVMPQPNLAWQFESSNVDSVTGLAPYLSTTGTYAAPTGGTITTVGGQRIHSFTTTGTTSITFLVPVTAQVLVVAGGGGGGGNNTTFFSAGGGGGAGEVYYSASYTINPGTYTVTVGGGGAGGVGGSGTSSQQGSDSIFGTITTNGGGLGGHAGGNGGNGGSGGGGGRGNTGGSSVKTAGGQGNSGGTSTGVSGAGGGGAGGAGADQTTTSTTTSVGSAGGVGVAYSITGSSVTYGAGGKGGDRSNNSNGASGTANRGNGGGGADANGAGSNNGGNGGSGIVVISYNAALYPAPTYVTGKYKQAINFNNTLSPSGQDPNCYAIYDVSAFNLTSNSATMSLWLNSGLTYPITTGYNPYYINLQGTTYYSLQTENTSGFRSSISFHTGSSPGSIIQTTAQTNTWNHYCAVFSNVGTTGASNTASYFYLNGSLVGSGNTLSQNFTSLNLGCQSSGGNGALCSIDDIRLFNTALTAAQVQSIYKAQGMPGRGELASLSQYIKSATGGDTVQDTNGYRIHTFTTVGTSTFIPATSGVVEVLVVAGGGSGGQGIGGGGGAGGLIYQNKFPVIPIALTVTVGAGGVYSGGVPQNGSNSVFGGLTAIGGGLGGNPGSVGNGGSGGGARGQTAGQLPGTGTAGQGNSGGNSNGTLSGGGGGAGAIGGNAGTSSSGNGGIGLAYSISGTLVYYAGGGGAGAIGGGTSGNGGIGGGGSGGTNTAFPVAGTANTGGGGGGGSNAGGINAYNPANGGSGIVIVRYPLPVRMTKAG